MTQSLSSDHAEYMGFFKFRGLRRILSPRFIYASFFWYLIAIKLSITLFAFFIYARFTPFLDADIYLSPLDMNRGGALRTEHAHILFRHVREILGSDLAVHVATSLLLAYVIWFVFHKTLHFMNKYLFSSALLLPHFMIWTGMVGKEPLAIAGFLLLIRACVDLVVKHRTPFLLIVLGLFLGTFKPHYLVAYGYLLMVSVFFAYTRMPWFHSPKNNGRLFVIGVILTGVLAFVFWEHLTPPLLTLMRAKEAMFLAQTGQVGANRVGIQWKEPMDFIYNMGWGLPVSILGPTLKETLARPLIAPAFLEGLIALGLSLWILLKTIQFAFEHPKYHAVIVLGLIPAILIGLLVNYPVGIFNPGSAVRYKQSLAPLLYFYALLLMGEVKKQACGEVNA